MGELLFRQNDLGQARKCYQRTAQISPYYPDVQNDLGVVCAQMGDKAAAVAHFRMALQIDPHSAIAEQNLAKARREVEAGERSR
jgi:Flp pilus assembly protein TadD